MRVLLLFRIKYKCVCPQRQVALLIKSFIPCNQFKPTYSRSFGIYSDSHLSLFKLQIFVSKNYQANIMRFSIVAAFAATCAISQAAAVPLQAGNTTLS